MGFYVIINKVDTPSFHFLLKKKKKHIFPPPCHPWRSQTRRQKVKNFTIRQRLKHFLWKSLNINRQYSNVCSLLEVQLRPMKPYVRLLVGCRSAKISKKCWKIPSHSLTPSCYPRYVTHTILQLAAQNWSSWSTCFLEFD